MGSAVPAASTLLPAPTRICRGTANSWDSKSSIGSSVTSSVSTRSNLDHAGVEPLLHECNRQRSLRSEMKRGLLQVSSCVVAICRGIGRAGMIDGAAFIAGNVCASAVVGCKCCEATLSDSATCAARSQAHPTELHLFRARQETLGRRHDQPDPERERSCRYWLADPVDSEWMFAPTASPNAPRAAAQATCRATELGGFCSRKRSYAM
jgi:hypothetical protein